MTNHVYTGVFLTFGKGLPHFISYSFMLKTKQLRLSCPAQLITDAAIDEVRAAHEERNAIRPGPKVSSAPCLLSVLFTFKSLFTLYLQVRLLLFPAHRLREQAQPAPAAARAAQAAAPEPRLRRPSLRTAVTSLSSPFIDILETVHGKWAISPACRRAYHVPPKIAN